jgi:hypothetical protein
MKNWIVSRRNCGGLYPAGIVSRFVTTRDRYETLFLGPNSSPVHLPIFDHLGTIVVEESDPPMRIK